MGSHRKVTTHQRALAVLMRREMNYSYRQIASKTQLTKSTVFDIVKNEEQGRKRMNTKIQQKSKGGRPQLLTARDKRKLHNSFKKLRKADPNFTIKEVVQDSGIGLKSASYRTFVRCIKKMGYGFYTSRRKGVMTTKDFKQRRKFAKEMKMKTCEYWTKDVAFYRDGVSFIYKRNPMSDALKAKNRVWRKRSEGLIFTTKGSKDLAGGKRLHLIVAIAHGKGVICAEEYKKMTGDYFASFIRNFFHKLFKANGKRKGNEKIFLMDNCPCQTSAKAKKALRTIGATMRVIPARSPDLNPIENMFNVLRKRLEGEVKEKNITHETWDEFVARVKRNIWSLPIDYIDKTIASMPKRIKLVISGKGHRTKY